MKILQYSYAFFILPLTTNTNTMQVENVEKSLVIPVAKSFAFKMFWKLFMIKDT